MLQLRGSLLRCRPGGALRKRRRPGAATKASALLLGSALALAACSGGGGGKSSDDGSTQAGSAPNVEVSGTVTFDLVPAVAGLGLDYAHTERSPARGVTVEAVDALTSTVLTSTTTDAAGHYALSLGADKRVLIEARAEMLQSAVPTWDVRVLNNTSDDALYVLDSPVFSTGQADQTRDLHAASGWDGAAYSGERAAAAFAILDVVYDAMQFTADAAPIEAFPPLVVHWSPDNAPTQSADGGPDPTTGELGTSFFNAVSGIYLLGAEDSDTDEYDRHVIAHEWGHYFENAFARSDSIGGPHTRGDQLDMRTAFSEGWGNALSGILTGDSVYTDTLGPRQEHGFAFDVERSLSPSGTQNPGWFSEESIQHLIYDLYDAAQDTPEDSLALGFAPIYDVLANHVAASGALTSLFPFIAGLKSALPENAAQIDALVGTEAIEPIVDDYGTGRGNAGYTSSGVPLPVDGSDVLPIYKEIVPGNGPVNVCSTDDFQSINTGSVDKLGSRAFLRFTASAPGTYQMTATATLVPSGEIADPDMILHQRDAITVADGAPDKVMCTAATPTGCSEQLSKSLSAGDYVLEVYEWTNTQEHDSGYPPIGRTCFDVEVTTP